MTGQIHDYIVISDKKYEIVGLHSGELFNPQTLGITPRISSTACRRGFICYYRIKDNQLYLNEFHLHLVDIEGIGDNRKVIYHTGPQINGVNPTKLTENDQGFNNVYKDLNLKIPFTGNILAGANFIQSLYVHMGFQSPWKYKNVLEIILDNGEVKNIQDVSKKMSDIREKKLEEPLEPPSSRGSREEISAWIDETFRLEYVDLDSF